MKSIFLWVYIFAFLVAAGGCASVSNRLSRYVYFDGVLISEARAGKSDALLGLAGYLVGFVAFFVWFYMALYGAS